MPATFDAFGVRFLYPDNWSVADRGEDEGDQGVTLDTPGGGFLAIELTDPEMSEDELIEQFYSTIVEDYEDVERGEPIISADECVIDFQFYYLDLLICSRLILLDRDDARLMIQIQAESRDFDQNAAVFDAITQQIRGTVIDTE